MKKKTNSKKNLIITAVSLGVLLLMLVAVLLGLRTFSDNGGSGEQEPTDPNPSQQEMTLETPFCDLSFPGQWAEQLKTQYSESDDGGAMTFSAQLGDKEIKLFTVVFSSHIDTACAPVGVLTGGDAPVMVSLELYDVEAGASLNDAELETLFAMQDECNYLTDQLRAREDFDTNYEPYFAPADVQIRTPFCTLSCPGQWADRIWWEFTPLDNTGSLSVYGLVAAEDALLFTFYFGTEAEDAAPLGSLRVGGGNIPISLVMAEPQDTTDWTAADWDDFAAMQEIINDLLQSLSQNPDFIPQ